MQPQLWGSGAPHVQGGLPQDPAAGQVWAWAQDGCLDQLHRVRLRTTPQQSSKVGAGCTALWPNV